MKIVDCFLTKVSLDMTIYRVNQENFFNECTYFPPYEMIYYAQCIALALEDQKMNHKDVVNSYELMKSNC